MVKTRVSDISGRVYKSSKPPSQQILRDIMKKPRKRRRASGPVPSFRQETMTQFGYGYVCPDDYIENESPDEGEVEQEKHKKRRKRRKTLGDSSSRERQSTLTQIGFVETRWVDLDLEDPEAEEENPEEDAPEDEDPQDENLEDEVDDETEVRVKREDSFPIWEGETADPEPQLRSKRLRNSRPIVHSSDEETTDHSDVEVDSHINDDGEDGQQDGVEEEEGNDNDYVKLGGSRELQEGPQFEDNTASDGNDDNGDTAMQVQGALAVRRDTEIGDSDEELDTEDLDQENESEHNNQTPLTSNPRPPDLSNPRQIQAGSMGPPVTPRKRRLEIPDSDAESEDISPERLTPLGLASPHVNPLQMTPSRSTRSLTKSTKSNSDRASMPALAIPHSQATTVDRSEYAQSQSISAQKTPTRQQVSRVPTKTSPFTLRSSQLLTESQMFPASLMNSAPMPPCWNDSDEEDVVGDDEDDEDDE